jgi:cytochrome P450
VPVRAVAVILEVPETRQADFKRWADSSVAAIGRSISDDERVAAERDIVEQQQYFAGELEDRRTAPRDDFLTDLLNAELTPDDGVTGGPLDMAEMLSIIRQIQVAGSETTASLLADLIVLLAEHPDVWNGLKADPSQASAIVEEGLRWASPNQGLFRIVMADTEIAGTPVAAGSTLWVMYGSADHDDSLFDEPETFRPDRAGLSNHIAFGHGIHFCLGAPLARLEMQQSVPMLAERFPQVVAADGAVQRDTFVLRGWDRVPVSV